MPWSDDKSSTWSHIRHWWRSDKLYTDSAFGHDARPQTLTRRLYRG